MIREKRKNKTMILYLFIFISMVSCIASNRTTETIVSGEALTEQEHLEFYEYIDEYNTLWDYFGGFVLSEEWIKSEPYYQLWNEENDVKILVDKTQENAVIYHDGKSMVYYMEYMLTGTSAHVSMDLLDLTNDGSKELLIYHGCGGTGVWAGTYDIIDLETMTKYVIEDYIYDLSARVAIEPIKINEDNVVLCRITDTYSNIYYGNVAGHYDQLVKYSYAPSSDNTHYDIEIDYDKKCLKVSIGLMPAGCFLNYLGELSSYLVYNKEDNYFHLSKEYTVTIHEPMEEEGN